MDTDKKIATTMNYYIHNNREIKATERVIDTAAFRQFVPLTEAQVAFYLQHPHASVSETMACTLRVPSLDEVKAAKTAAIRAHDTSEEVNGFFLGGAPMWLAKEERAALKMRFEAEQATGRETTCLWAGTTQLTLPVTTAIALLQALELYASACYDVTASHLAAVAALDTAQAVQAYDHTAGYPTKPDFALPE